MDACPKYDLGGSEWLAAFHAVMATAVAGCAASDPDLTFSMSELTEGAPAHVAQGAAVVGWSCFVEGGRLVRFETGRAEGVQFTVIADYAAMRRLAGFEIGGDPERAAEYKALVKSIGLAGQVRSEGEYPRLPKAFAVIHDVVARFTR